MSEKEITEQPKKLGRKPKLLPEGTAEQIQKYAEDGCNYNDIALILGLTVEYLREHFLTVIKRGKAVRRAKLYAAQTKLALAGNSQMLVWLGKQDLNQSDFGATDGEDELPPY